MDGHNCVFGCYPRAKHSLHKAIHCIVRISLDQIICFRELCGATPASSGTNLAMLLLSYCHPTVAWSETQQLHSLLSGHLASARLSVLPSPKNPDKPSLVWFSRNTFQGTSDTLCTLNSVTSWRVWQEQPRTLQCFSAVCLGRFVQNSLVGQQNNAYCF